MRNLFFLLFIVFIFSLKAQPTFIRNDSIAVLNAGTLLKNGWAGGLNFTEWSAIDLDFDGVKDLVVFDKSGEKIRTFKNDNIFGEASYKHAPQFQNSFPLEISSWALFYDFNNDGKEDIFTYALGLGGIRVYKNISANGNLQFSLFKNYLITDYLNGYPQTNIPVSSVALPALNDTDNDGDMDIITFQTVGVVLELHKNMSVENYGSTDSLVFSVVDKCFGDAAENNCEATLNYSFCPLLVQYHNALLNATEKTDAVMHSGSCLTCIDMDGDNDKDIVVGDISCDSVEYFRNGGSASNAHFDFASKLFPNTIDPISFQQFPCTYFIDIDNDTKRDLIAAPNLSTSENYTSVWFYKNNGEDNTPNFSLIQKDFLQNQMLDFGEGAYPTTFDYDSDGDLDIVVGNFGYYQPVSQYSSSLALLENIGTNNNPTFSLINTNYLNLSSLILKNLAPSFGDMDGDGDKDLIIGDISGKLNYFTNTSSAGNVASFTLTSNSTTGFLSGIDIGNNAYPQIIDVNKDGLNDLLIGEYDGTINYFKNIGNINTPLLDAVVTNFGGVKVNKPGYYEAQSTPFLFNENGNYKLLVGSERGYLYMYNNIDNNLNGNFTLVDSIYNNIIEGKQVSPCLADFNSDGILDMILGNYSGGLSFYTGAANSTNFSGEINSIYTSLAIYPNPARDNITLQFNNFNHQLKEISILDENGKTIVLTRTAKESVHIDLKNFDSGFYIVQTRVVMPGNQVYFITKKLVLNH
jgi:hypothetical protein